MKVKDFVENYSNNATDNLKEKYLKNNLEIKKYIPFVEKNLLVDSLLKITMFGKKAGLDSDKSVEIFKVNSVSQYLFFTGLILKHYTNLEVDLSSFTEDYDLLRQEGVLEEIMNMIPKTELEELKLFCDMRKSDYIMNFSNPQTFIQNQITRIGDLFSTTLAPILEKIGLAFEKMDEKDLDKFANKLDKLLKKVK